MTVDAQGLTIKTTEELLEQAGTTPAGAEGVVFLPYLAGERSPIWDPKATGAFVGLTLGHGRGHLTRAILEASALAIRHVAEPMLAAELKLRGDQLVRAVNDRQRGRPGALFQLRSITVGVRPGGRGPDPEEGPA